jgi:hypothetical protein
MKENKKSALRHTLELFGCMTLGFIISQCNLGCGIHVASPEEIQAAYTAEQLGCVENAKTREEADACRKAVNRKYGLCDGIEWPRISPCD